MLDSSGSSTPHVSGEINAQGCGASGSEFQCCGVIRAGSNEVVVEDIGDFRPGQWVTVSGCYVHYYGTLYNTAEPYLARNQRTLEDEVELRGLADGRSWQTFLVHFDKTHPVTFRWMVVDPAHQTLATHAPIFHRHWQWQGQDLPIREEWVPLVDGVEMRFRKRDWKPGESISFHARNRLLAQIIEIRGRTLVLSERANRDAPQAVVRHHDQVALQAALDRAVAERKMLFIPAGRYRLSTGLWVRNASVRIEGVHRDHTILDISEDHTAAFWIAGGREVVIRNLAMVGHTGFLELPSYMALTTATGHPFWVTANEQMQVKGCAAVNAVSTEHLLFEDLRVTRMASEAFYLHGSDRYGKAPYIQAPHEGMPELQKQYTKSCIYHRCHVSDCAFNAFNNNDHAENTSILHCHVERTANFCENASRFTRIIGNYVKDGCPTSVHAGVITDPHALGPTQAVIADNVFEGGILNGGLHIDNCATQVTVTNNLFVGYSKESAIFILGGRRVIVTGNHIDLTRLDSNADNARCGICVEASNVTIADNHIYARGERTDRTTGINVADHAVNVHIHDNLIENCHGGLRSGRRIYVGDSEHGRFEFHHTVAEVAEAVDPRAFREKGLPRICDYPPGYSGWLLRWLTGPSANRIVTLDHACGGDQTVELREECPFNAGDRFAIYPRRANWQVHHNTLTDCTHPIVLDLFSQEGLSLENNHLC